MGFLAIRAALKFPHDREALAGFGRGFEVVAKVQKTLDKPRLLVEPVVAKHRLFGARAGNAERRQPQSSRQNISPRRFHAPRRIDARGRGLYPRVSKPGDQRCERYLRASPFSCWRHGVARHRPATSPTSIPRWRRSPVTTAWRSDICVPATPIWPRWKSIACARPGARCTM